MSIGDRDPESRICQASQRRPIPRILYTSERAPDADAMSWDTHRTGLAVAGLARRGTADGKVMGISVKPKAITFLGVAAERRKVRRSMPPETIARLNG